MEVATKGLKGKGETIVKKQNLSELKGLVTMKDRKRPCKGDPCPLPRGLQHPRSHSTRPRIVPTGVGVTSVLRPSDANGLITTAEMDEEGACLSSTWTTHS